MNLGGGFEGALDSLRAGNFEKMTEFLNEFEAQGAGGENAGRFSAQDVEKRQRIAGAVAAFAKTPGGGEFLDGLVNTTLWRMVYPVGISGLPREERADFAAMREGQNGLVYNILRLIAEGRGDIPPPKREVI